ncbi:MAG: porin, partial [Thalassolituus sp.]
IVRYQSPSLSGLVLTIDHINSEAADTANSQSVSAVFSKDAVYAAVAYDFRGDITVARVTGQINLESGVSLGALWESQDNDGETTDGMMVSAAVKTGSATTLKAQYGSSDIKSEGATQIALGLDYKLAKNAKLFGYVSDAETDVDGSGEQIFGAGAEFKF